MTKVITVKIKPSDQQQNLYYRSVVRQRRWAKRNKQENSATKECGIFTPPSRDVPQIIQRLCQSMRFNCQSLAVQFRCNLNALFQAIWQKNSHQMQALLLSHNQSQSLESTSRRAHKRWLSMRRQASTFQSIQNLCAYIAQKQ